MPVAIVVGIQWGDEGKGKVVDYLTEEAGLVVRFQGGNNAGHTLVIDGKKTALKLIPSGILRDNTRCLLSSGMVLDPSAFLSEMDELQKAGADVSPQRLGVAGEIQLILPYHKAMDLDLEDKKGDKKIGTTGRGIGPAYEERVSRAGIRLIDLCNHDYLRTLVERNVAAKNRYFESVIGSDTRFSAEDVYKGLVEISPLLTPYIANVSVEVNEAIKRGDNIMFEGAQGCHLDVNHGTYPYVTSSNTLASYACVSAGFGPRDVDLVIGIAKAYCTRVGSGPFPTEDEGASGDQLRNVGQEFGTVTGRPRRCGWFDAIGVQRTVRLNGVDTLVLTKLDVLSGFDKVKVGTSYKLEGNTLNDMPASFIDTERIETGYEELAGWPEDISGVRSFDELPENAKALIKRIEELVGCPIGGFSVGPDRVQTVIMDENIRKFASS